MSCMVATMLMCATAALTLWRAHAGMVWCVQQELIREREVIKITYIVRWVRFVLKSHGAEVTPLLPLEVAFNTQEQWALKLSSEGERSVRYTVLKKSTEVWSGVW